MTRAAFAAPSRMRFLGTIQYDSAEDGDNDPTYSTFFANVPYSREPVTGGETYRGRQIEATTTHLIVMRFIPGVLPTMRLVDATETTRAFEFSRVHEEDGRRKNLVIQATEVVA